MPPKGFRITGRHARGVERPHVWIIGEDAGSFKHSLYMPWQKARAQANFRAEEWLIEFEEFWLLWKDDWLNRGRKPENVCMTRKEKDGPWSIDNVHIITRKQHLSEQGQTRTGLSYNKTKPRKSSK